MNDLSCVGPEMNDFSLRADGPRWTNPAEGPEKLRLPSPDVLPIAVAATFTADLLKDPLAFWMNALAIPAKIELAGYGQMVQELLNPRSLLAENKGIDVLLIRAEDWIRDRRHETVERNVDHLRGVAHEVASGVAALRTRTNAPIIAFLCASSTSLSSDYVQPIADAERDLSEMLGTITNVHCCTHADLMRLYPAEEWEDAVAERIGHIPYTSEYFAAMATLLARRIRALTKPPYKVIALDCDNTLWKGVCGEDGAHGVELTPAHLQFQKVLVRQHDSGVLLCLCSKNNRSDVEDVFESRPEMPLRMEHHICARVDWNAKSTNLASLASELDVSLDSFVFIDDSAMECAEVRTKHPGVLALQFPKTAEEMVHFLDHVWAFDRIGVTDNAKRRTAQYRENRARAHALEESTSIDQFLASLQLEVDIGPMAPEHLPRVAELVQRTNQFNLTGVRRRAAQIQALLDGGDRCCLIVHARDRFGDYGLVGAILYALASRSLQVDTFVLSCRALGRGVEHRIVKELARIARANSLAEILLHYRQSERNEPAWKFLNKSFAQFCSPVQAEQSVTAAYVFAVPIAYAEALGEGPSVTEIIEPQTKDVGAGAASPGAATNWHQTAYRLSRLPDLMRELGRKKALHQPISEYVAPRTANERVIATIWAGLLRLEDVSIRADFFELGGDSLLAVQAIGRMQGLLGHELSVYEFFDCATIEALAMKFDGAIDTDSKIEPADRERPLTLSSAQKRLWFIDQLEQGSAAYHIPLSLRLQGTLDCTALGDSLDALLERHEALRTVFKVSDGEPTQVITHPIRFDLQLVDVQAGTQQGREDHVLLQAQDELAMPFDLTKGPLIRGRLLRLAPKEHHLLITMHHMISDGWSVRVLMQELSALYQARRDGRSDQLSPLPIQYADYARWQQAYLAGAQLQEQLAYWSKHLHGAPELLELPSDHPRPAVRTYRGATASVDFDPAFTAELKEFSQREKLTITMTVYAAWTILLSRISDQTDIVVGMPVANRRRSEFEGLIGFFVNTLAVRVSLEDDPSVSGFLRRVKKTLLAAYAHQDAPFEHVVELLHPTRSLSHSALFQVMLVMQNPSREPAGFADLELSERNVPLRTAKFDLTLSLQEFSKELRGSINYATDLFSAATIERWVACFKTILLAMMRERGLVISRLPLISDLERHRVVELFNATQAAYPSEKLIHELFEQEVHRNPQAVAVQCAQQSLTYGELNDRANQLARHLRSHGVGPDQLVAICLRRSVEMVVAFLGTLKAGGAYVPLDPSNPDERLAHILRDSAPRVLLTHTSCRDALPDSTATTIMLDRDWCEVARHDAQNLNRHAQAGSRNLAYVIYTSGSTGKPKGVMIEHRSIVNYAVHAARQFNVAAGNGSLVCSSFSFDLMLTGFYPTLLCGRTVRLAGEQQGMPTLADDVLGNVDLAPLKLTPSHLTLLEEPLREGKLVGRVKVLVLGGEPLQADLVHLWRAHAPGTQIFNHYGPTEATVGCVVYEVGEHVEGTIPIGRPISNVRIYILDKHGQIVPIGVAGEIHIAGAGIARGYLNQPELTLERFAQDPYCTDPQARMYKTGDLARWRADGTIEYLGRNDQQVKIRGFRIELGEIEAQLTRCERVKDAAVMLREDAPGDKRLVAYVVPHGVSDLPPPSVEELRTHLSAGLPEYMVPSAFVIIDRLPLTPNGKLDRRALRPPELNAFVARSYEAPQGEIEEILAGIWQSLLRVERVGRQDNFFELGGHSLLIAQMIGRLQRAGLATEVRRVFESPTLADLAKALANETLVQFDVPPNGIPAQCEAIAPQMLTLVELTAEQIDLIVGSVPGGAANIQDIYPLAPLQEGILFHHLLDDHGGDVYVVPTLLELSSRQRLDQLVAAFQQVIDRHDVLRTSLLWEQLPRPVQVVHRRAALPVTQITLDPDRNPREQVRDWIKPQLQKLDLRRAPLMQMRIAAGPDGEWYALLQLHHIVNDATSLDIVIDEVVACLTGRVQHLTASVPYRNHVAQALAYARTLDAEEFFRRKLGDVREPTVPFGLLDIRGDGTRIDQAARAVEPELALRIRAQARQLGVSAATIFHGAAALIVAHTTGRDDVVFGTVLLGRLQASAGAQQALGMFINTLPLRLQLEGVSAKELIERTQHELIELLAHEQASLAVAQRCSGISGSAPLFSALLNYRHSRRKSDAEWIDAEGIRLLTRHGFTNYPITFSIDDVDGGFKLTAQTDRRIDPQRMVNYLYNCLRSLVEALQFLPRTPALALDILPQNERWQVIRSFNETRAPHPRSKLVHELFEMQQRRTPDTLAVVYEAQSLTYSQLDRRANQLARYLRSKPVGPGALVGICVERSLDMVVGLLGVLKAGAAYIPLDPNYPADRLQHMLEDANPRVVLTQRALRAGLPPNSAEIIALDEVADEIDCQSDESQQTSELGLTSLSLVYVIYTSGSTGRPKGTAMSHRAMTNLIEWHRCTLGLRVGQRVLQFAALSFDVAFQETFTTLCNGGTLVLLDEWVRRDPRALTELVRAGAIERLFIPPLMLQNLAESFQATAASAPTLRDVITAGEQLRITPPIVEFFERHERCRLHNHYGPTETHVVTALTLSGAPRQWPSLPTIGRPIANTRIYVLDGRQQPAPFGVIGEIYIAGTNVANGYLNRAELTATRFLADPFVNEPAGWMYRTGDLGRWREDGSIEYLGRNDDQIKIRGYRIELGEIEAWLCRHDDVKDAAVAVSEDARREKRLVAYVTRRGATTPSAEELRTYLKSLMPDYMVPSAFVALDSFPLTPSGKLNRQALPTPEADAYATRQYDPPRSEIERILARIWEELLQVERVGRDDDFFDLGGHSLLAMQLMTRIQSSLLVEMPIRSLFDFPTLKQHATEVETCRHTWLLTKVQDRGGEVEELLKAVAAMPDSEVRQLIDEWARSGAR